VQSVIHTARIERKHYAINRYFTGNSTENGAYDLCFRSVISTVMTKTAVCQAEVKRVFVTYWPTIYTHYRKSSPKRTAAANEISRPSNTPHVHFLRL
jgi:hypothetical protein